MPDPLLTQGTSVLLSQGLLGVICCFLLWYAGRLEKKLDEAREAHKIEIAAERKLNADLQDARLAEAKMLLEVVQSNKAAVTSLAATMGVKPLI